jgi:hypothetical protein
MSLIFPKDGTAVETGKPRLHALVIGVADYPHLIDGTGKPAADQLGLRQITTSLHTAKAVTQWLLHGYNNPDRPLGSVETLISPAQKLADLGGAAVDVEAATFGQIKAAFSRWVKRCSSHPENIAFFYFCGHGLQKEQQYLLPQDFADPDLLSMWENCINFDKMRTGMQSCKAQTQLFFVDACRETPFGVLSQKNVDGQELISSTFTDSVKCSAAYMATTSGRQAFGPADDVTYFGQAVIACLDGIAAEFNMGKWGINAQTLGGRLGNVMRQYAEQFGQPLDCNPDVDGYGFIHSPAKGRTLASIRCSSQEATAAAEIELRRQGESYRAGLNDSKPLYRIVESGDWDVEVKFPANGFPAQTPVRCTLYPGTFEGVPIP